MIKIIFVMGFIVMGMWAKNIPTVETKQTRIIHGTKVSSTNDMWQFIVALKYDGKQYCGGSLIAPNWVLTAAHCLSNEYGNPYSVESGDSVGVGSYNVNMTTNYSIKRFIVHPSYDYQTLDNDIGLIELNTNVTHVPTINYDTSYPLSTNTQTRVAGWGTMTEGYDDYPVDLREALVPIVDFNQCNSSTVYNGILTNNMICAGYFKATRDSCQGDSGGPLIVDNKQVGIVSWGEGCAKDGFPGIYTKVQNYTMWIRNFVPIVPSVEEAHWVPITVDDIMVVLPYNP